MQDGDEVDSDDVGLERPDALGTFVALGAGDVVRAPVGGRFDAEKPPDVLLRAAGHGAFHDELILREELRGLRQPQHGVVGRTNLRERPLRSVRRLDPVFGREVLETAPQIERVGVAAVEFQKPRGAEKHRFDGMRGEPFAQHDFVGDFPGQPQEGFLILTVAQRAEIEQVESLVPVPVGFAVQGFDRAHFPLQAVEDQRRADFGALQSVERGQITAAGVSPGPGPQAFDRPCLRLRHIRTG